MKKRLILSAFACVLLAHRPLCAATVPVLVSCGGAPGEACRADFPLPGGASFRMLGPSPSWTDFARLDFSVELAPEAPRGMQALVFVRDWDNYWYQNLLPAVLIPGRNQRLSVDISPAARDWEPRGHDGSWNLRVLMDPVEVAVRVFGSGTGETWCVVGNASASAREDSGAPFIRNVKAPGEVAVYDRFRVTFDLPDRYPDPFDGSKVTVTALISTPDGREVSVDGFFTQDYYRQVENTGDRLFPRGRPHWEARYTPLIAGRHLYRLRIRDALGAAEWGPGVFNAGPPSKPGFVRVSKKDPRFFEFDNGSPFFPIGHNIRSPHDTRHDGIFPWKDRWVEGSSAYRHYFACMEANGENMTEIWSATWSLGLEWTPQWRGYHGIGRYNMMNAWELDRVLDDADESGIYINLVIHNHGKFSTFSDREWDHNPFNTRNGGYLSSPEEYFTNPRAAGDFLKLMRYMLARWGYSTRIFAWELWSELNLTGDGHSFYRSQEVVDWHKLMGAAVKEMDVNRHMIASHYSGDYTMQNTNIVALPEMDFAPVDAYHASADPLAIVDLMFRTAHFNRAYGKPALITEFGGSHIAQDVQHLEDTLHAALWASPATDIGAAPMMWWWMFIDEEDKYREFAALSRFMNGEDRRDPSLAQCYVRYTISPAAEGSGGVRLRAEGQRPDHTGVWCLKNGDRALGWITRTMEYPAIDPRGPPTATNMVMVLDSMNPGSRIVEFWNTTDGAPVRRVNATVTDASLTVPIPPFARDIAFKVKTGE